MNLNPTYAQFTTATPFPGTKLYDLAKSSGSFRITNWDEYSQLDQKGYFDYEHLKGKVIIYYVKKAYRTFYLNPKFIIKILFFSDTFFRK